jgi:Pentapeptide repeats (8 copies)
MTDPDPKPPSQGGQSQNEKWSERIPWRALFFAAGIALFVLAGWMILDWYIEPKSSGQKKDLVQALGLLTVGVAGAVGIYFTWRNLRISQSTLQTTRAAQALERFGNAVELLGAVDSNGRKIIESRVAGIYTLEGIAKGSPDQPDQLEIIAGILNSYIRNNAPTSLTSLEPSQEIQQGISTLSHLTALIPERTPGASFIALGNTALPGARLADAFLRGANFEHALLTEADLQGANLQRANLRDAKVTDKQLANTLSLQRAIMPDGSMHP